MTIGITPARARAALAAGAVALALAAGPVAAQQGGQNYFGIYEALTRHGKDRVGLTPGGAIAGILRRSGPEIGVLVGRQWSGPAASVALEAELSMSGVGDRVSRGPLRARSRTRAEAGLRLLFGRPFAGGTAYLAGGAAFGLFDYRVTGAGVNIDQTYVAPGYSAAVGWQVPIDGTWDLRTEWRFTSYQGKDLSGTTFTTRATPIGQSIRIAMTRNF